MSRRISASAVTALAALGFLASPATAGAAALARSGPRRPAPAAAFRPLRRAGRVHLPRTQLPHLPPAATVTTGNWAGYTAVADRRIGLRYVAASFRVPRVNCAKSPVGTSGFAYAGLWVGLDGYRAASRTVEQTGVDASCDSGHNAAYYAWYEMYPDDPVGYGGIRPGDAISASVYWNGSRYVLTLTDRTSRRRFSVTRRCPARSVCANGSAEVITEDPGSSVPEYDLADFGTVNYRGAVVTSRDGARGGLAAKRGFWTTSKIRMVDPAGKIMAAPSALRAGSFSVAWDRAG